MPKFKLIKTEEVVEEELEIYYGDFIPEHVSFEETTEHLTIEEKLDKILEMKQRIKFYLDEIALFSR